jgi:peptidoglycan hydrolase-like protein with peptidoglycan-binding domain
LKDNELNEDIAVGDYFALTGGVGREAVNDRPDVIKAQTLLGHAGYVDLERLGGPTGWYGKPLELGIRQYQKDNGLVVDGVMLPGGETIRSLEQDFGSAFRKFASPGPDLVDRHHDRLARGESGLLRMDRASDAPYGVPPAAVEGQDKISAGEQMAQLRWARPGAPFGPLPVPKAPVIALPRRKQPLEKYDDFLAQNRIALLDGIRNVFGDIAERHETDNTRLSSNIIVQECNEVIRENVPLQNFKHIAGASEGGEGKKELSEKAVKGRKLERGGGGHSFPDVLFLDKETNKVVAINSATESSPGKYIRREVKSFDRLMQNVGEWVAKITGKKRPDESEDDYRKRARQVCEEAFEGFLNQALEKPDQSDDVTPDRAAD